MFGRSLAETVEIEKKFGGGGYVPFLVHKCCDYVKKNGTYVCTSLCLCVCMRVCVCVYMCVMRERDREKQRQRVI